MTTDEIKTNEIIAEAIDRLIEKYQKKADKERAKVESAYITYKGEKYYSEKELEDAYVCDIFTSSTYDRLLEKLNNARGQIDKDAYTESEMLVVNLKQHKANLLYEIAQDKQHKERQASVDKRLKELVDEGYSLREAQTIVSNEELMRYE